MVASVQPATVVDEASPLRTAVQISGITGGKATDPLWTSQVSNENFRQALELSLKQHTILGGGDAPLALQAILVSLDQPVIGFDMTVTSTVTYQITNAAGQSVFDETVATPYTANFSDAFAGVERLRLANEGSIKKNIRTFIQKLVAASRSDPARFGPALTSALRLKLG